MMSIPRLHIGLYKFEDAVTRKRDVEAKESDGETSLLDVEV